MSFSMTYTTPLSSILQGHAQAIGLMQQQEFERASHVLDQLLDPHERSYPSDDTTAQLRVPVPELQRYDVHDSSSQNTKDDFWIYPMALHLQLGHQPFPPSPTRMMMTLGDLHELISCLILYNMGLCSHLRSIMNIMTKDKTTKRALSAEQRNALGGEALHCYEVALMDYDCWDYARNANNTNSNNAVLTFVQLALHNNAASLHARLWGNVDDTVPHSMVQMSQLLGEWMNNNKTMTCRAMVKVFVDNIYYNAKLRERPAPMA